MADTIAVVRVFFTNGYTTVEPVGDKWRGVFVKTKNEKGEDVYEVSDTDKRFPSSFDASRAAIVLALQKGAK